ncbi:MULTISPECIES: alternative ribosome rescue factor ArfA [Thalassotalea]|uniref:Alternative ribosome rescue factor ArfA n=1 Tax=Thalassotalea castellviae TaxID=3075612 RepID=A0ABU3A596_9GAMM|nr:alternative ribosome rescue factor ArfA [Thalassotalea sp. W431]MDT0605344.1 alternative ribosome rescue factor ArfA [Thalassotalea sp. W431]
MSKSKRSKKSTPTSQADIGRGSINDNFLAAIVTSKMYKLQVVKAKKGKGSFQRNDKHKGKSKQDSYLIAV